MTAIAPSRPADVLAGLAALLPEMERSLGEPVTRISLNIDDWSLPHPRRLNLGHPVRLGWFHTVAPGTVTFGHGSGPRTTLHVPITEVPS
ncbi:MAG: hypothetical protein JWO12_2626 [Frankiales bacterium]|nr:hypothetical protein [Frankiales bacterium]